MLRFAILRKASQQRHLSLYTKNERLTIYFSQTFTFCAQFQKIPYTITNFIAPFYKLLRFPPVCKAIQPLRHIPLFFIYSSFQRAVKLSATFRQSVCQAFSQALIPLYVRFNTLCFLPFPRIPVYL